MNASLDELLRDGMERFTADLHAPADLADRARRRRGQHLVFRTAASCAAAAVAVAAVAVGAVSAGNSNLGGPAGPAERSDVEYVHLISSSRTYSEMTWAYRGTFRQQIRSSAGRLLEDDAYHVLRYSRGHLALTRTIVEYGTRTWARARLSQAGVAVQAAPTCARPGLGFPDSPASLPGWIRKLHKAMDCGDFTIAGTARINGVEAVKLVGTSKLDKALRSSTIWIKRADDAPLLMTGGDVGSWRRAEISWLRPTRANQALLRVPVPAGFRRVGIGDFPNAILPPVGGCHKERSTGYAEVCTAVSYSSS